MIDPTNLCESSWNDSKNTHVFMESYSFADCTQILVSYVNNIEKYSFSKK